MQRLRRYALLVAVALPLAVSVGPGRARHEQWPPAAEIVAIDLAGRLTNLTHNPGSTRPAVSRDGRIVFLSTGDGPPDFYVMDGHGRNVRRLTASPFASDGSEVGWNEAGFSRASWSYRGKKIAFDAQHLTPPPSCFSNCVRWWVYVTSPDGSGLRMVGTDGRAPVWSRDGRSLAYMNVADPYGDIDGVTIARLDGSRTVHVRGDNPDEIGPVWSPTGEELAFQTRPPLKLPWIYLVQADGRGKRRLAQGQNPAWSPDGQRLAFIRDGRLMTIRRDGKGLRSLSPKGDMVDTASWSPKGNMLALGAGDWVETLSADGKREHVVYHGSLRAPDGLTAPVWTPDGNRIIVAVEAG
jgi:Tol biopolymer transport system component